MESIIILGQTPLDPEAEREPVPSPNTIEGWDGPTGQGALKAHRRLALRWESMRAYLNVGERGSVCGGNLMYADDHVGGAFWSYLECMLCGRQFPLIEANLNASD